jgi:DNA-binding PadR family transcriptional regulator
MQHPCTGYDIAREFKERAFSNFWYATHSQIYPELKRLTDEGLITYDIVIQGEKLEKKKYTLTEKGREEFMEWLHKDEDLMMTAKDIFRLRTFFSQFYTGEEFRHQLTSHIEKHKERKKQLQFIQSNVHFKGCKPGNPAFGDYMVLEGAILREDSYIEWLQRCLTYYQDVE